MYSAKLEVGTPAQTFELQLDTGSSDMYLYSSACANCPGGPKFDYTKSSTYHAGDPSDELQYGIGYAKGIWANDTVSIAGATVFDQTFRQCISSRRPKRALRSGIYARSLVANQFSNQFSVLATLDRFIPRLC